MDGKYIPLQPGDIVRIRNEKDILASLDASGTLHALPFMPEMRKYCGKAFRVYKRADTSCVDTFGPRTVGRAVYLEGVRCDGWSHDGCQKLCPIIWKEAWLEKIDHLSTTPHSPRNKEHTPLSPWPFKTVENDVYFCQSSELLKATRPLPWWYFAQYLRNIVRGDQPFSVLVREFSTRTGIKVRSILKTSRRLPWGGELTRTPKESLKLEPGELVEVKSLEEIRQTIDHSGKNRGLEFAPEMMKYCGRKLMVLSRVEKIIMETTGKMLPIADTVILQDATCDGCFHRGCARNHFFHWREIWLRRVDPDKQPVAGAHDLRKESETQESLASLLTPADCDVTRLGEPAIPDPYLKRIEELLEPKPKKNNPVVTR